MQGGGTEPLNLALADHALITVDHIVLMFGFDEGESQIDHVTNSTWEMGQIINLLILMHHYCALTSWWDYQRAKANLLISSETGGCAAMH